MIAVDSNLLIYAHREESPFFAPAKRWLEQVSAGAAPWAIPWPCIHEFIGHVTNPRIYKRPTPPGVALAAAESLMASPSVTLLHETDAYWSEFRTIVLDGSIVGGRIHDAKIAALIRAHGVSHLATCDRDFSRFAGIAVFNPLHGDAVGEERRRRARSRTR